MNSLDTITELNLALKLQSFRKIYLNYIQIAEGS